MFGRGLYSNLPICGILVGICFAYRLERFIVEKNRKLLGHSFTVKTMPSAVHCCAKCTVNPVCLAANFNPTTGECQLCDETPEKYGTVVEVNADWNMYYVPGPCNASWLYYGTSCYWLEPTTANWSSSVSRCVELGSRLIEIDDQQENDFLFSVLQDARLPIYLGVNDIATEGTFELPSGATAGFLKFGPNEGLNDWEDCVALSLSHNGGWSDVMCHRLETSMCEKPLV